MTCHKPQLVKLPPFYKTVACKRYLIGAEPPHIGHYLGYLSPPPLQLLAPRQTQEKQRIYGQTSESRATFKSTIRPEYLQRRMVHLFRR